MHKISAQDEVQGDVLDIRSAAFPLKRLVVWLAVAAVSLVLAVAYVLLFACR